MPPFIHRKLQESGAAGEVPSGGLLGTDWLLLVIKGSRGTTPAGETLGGICVVDFGMAVADL